MRLLHVVATGSRRGAELFASDLVRALSGADVEQRVAVLRSPNGVSIGYEAPVRVLGDGGRSVPGLGVDAGALRQLRGIVDAWRPDIVQAHGGETLKNAVFATVGQSVPLIYRRIGTAPPWMSTLPMRPVYAALMRRASRVVTVADVVRVETVRRFHVPAAKVVTIPNGVDVSRMQARHGRRKTRAAAGIPSDAPVSLTLGALVWEKDPLAHLEIASRVLREVPTAVHLFVGDGPLRPRLEEGIRERKLEDRVMLLGSRTDVGDVLAAADVLVFASRTDGMEGMPASVIEAGIVGRPVVAYSVAGLPEVVIDGETGLLVEPRDVAGLADGIVNLLRDERARTAMGVAARDRCRSSFDIKGIAARYLDVYEELVATPR